MDTVFAHAAVPSDLEEQILAAVDLGLAAAEPVLRAMAEACPEHAHTILGWLDTLRHVQPPEPEDTEFPGHDLLGRLGKGGMGVVYLARDQRLGRTVALKTLPPPFNRDAVRVARFLREARAAALLRHPHICPIHVIGDSKNQPFFTMDHVAGVTLHVLLQRLRAQGCPASALTGQHWHAALFASAPTPAAQQLWPARHAEIVARLLAPIADALAHAHAHGVVHRDVKPANVMLRFDGSPVLLDFGLARLEAEATLTHGDAVGTPHAMAPEQLGSGHAVSAATDVWALGVVLYELLTLTLPFPGTVPEMIAGILQEEPTPPRAIDGDVSRALTAVCLRCLEKDPARRYPSAAALAADLRAFLDHRPLSVQPLGVLGRAARWMRRRPAAAAAIAFAGLAMVGIPSTWAIVEMRRRVDVEAEQGRTNEALRTARTRAAELAFSVGKLAAERGAWDEALDAYADALRHGHPGRVDVGLRQLAALRGLDEVAEFADLLAELGASSPTPEEQARLWLLEGDLRASNGTDPSAGLDLIRRALETTLLPPADREYATAMLAPDLAQARAAVERALAFDKTHRAALGLHCSLLALTYDWNTLRDALTRFATQYPDDPTAIVLRYLGTQVTGTDPASLFHDLSGSPMRGPITTIHGALGKLRARAATIDWSFVVVDAGLAALAEEFALRAVQIGGAIVVLRQRGFVMPMHPAIARRVPDATGFLGIVLKEGPAGLRRALAQTAGTVLEELPDAFPDRAAFVIRGWLRFSGGNIDAAIADFARAEQQPSLVDVAFGTRLPLDRIGAGIQLALASDHLAKDPALAQRAEVAAWFRATVARALATSPPTALDLAELTVFAGIAGDAPTLLDILPHGLRAHGDRLDQEALAAHLATLHAFVPAMLEGQALATPEELPRLIERLREACGK